MTEDDPADLLADGALMRIGELGRRVGVSTHALRAWERRYGLLHPTRTPSGYRLYSADDEQRIHDLLRLRSEGVPTSEAASRVLGSDRLQRAAGVGHAAAPAVPPARVTGFHRAMHEAVDSWDEGAAHAAIDELFRHMSVAHAIEDGILPFLSQLGQRWADGDVSIGQEHFASGVVRRRLSAFTLAWGTGHGRLAVVACPPRENHDIGPFCFAVLLARSGWRVRFLGADTPIRSIGQASRAGSADIIVVASIRSDRFATQVDALHDLSTIAPLYLGGRGADEHVALACAAVALPQSMSAAVEQITADIAPQREAVGT